MTNTAIPMAYTESVVYRCLLIFNWKKCAGLDDNFLTIFFGIFNVLVGILICFARAIFGSLYHEGYVIISGIHVDNSTSNRPT